MEVPWLRSLRKKVPHCGRAHLHSTVAGTLLYPAADLDGYGPPGGRPGLYTVSQLTLLGWALST